MILKLTDETWEEENISEHTPRPWQDHDATTEGRTCEWHEVLDDRGRTIATLDQDSHAASPDLLEALSDLVTERDNFGGCPNSSPAWDVARTAIAKATK